MEEQEIKDALSNLEVKMKGANETERKNALAGDQIFKPTQLQSMNK